MIQKSMLLTIMMMLFSASIFAKEAITKTSFMVSGSCEMCKTRIEKATKTKGVKSAVWNEKTHILTIVYVPSKISVDQIKQNIASAGYDTDIFKSTVEDYNLLPQCCQYERVN